MKTITVNFQRDEKAFQNEGKTIYLVNRLFGQPTGFMNAFNITLSDKVAKKVDNLLNTEAQVYAYPDARCKTGYKFIQY